MRIAVLEDDKDQVELMQSWFKDVGHECQACGSGSELKTVLKRETFDLLMVDWNLPDTTGSESSSPRSTSFCMTRRTVRTETQHFVATVDTLG